MRNKYDAHCGSALIAALFLMTLVAIASTAMSVRLQMDIYRVSLAITSDKLYLASQEVTFWAMDKLIAQQIEFTKANLSGKIADFPLKLQKNYPNITILGHLYDLQSRFNINNVKEPRFQQIFLRLLKNTLTETPANERKSLLQATIHWVSPYLPERGHDNLLSYYAKQTPPYRPGFQPMASISELRRVRGVTKEIYQTLLPFITALPTATPVNVNTAALPLLRALGQGLTNTEAEELLQARGDKGITDINDIRLLMQKFNIGNEEITLESTYYLAEAITSTQDLSLSSYVIIKRTYDNQKNPVITIIQESYHTI